MKLLHVDSSALAAYSVSRQLTAEIVAELRHRHAGLEVVYRDLATQPLPHWTPLADASHPDALMSAEMLEEFLAADLVVIGAPMYNFAIPSQLKAWIDRIVVAGKTFRYTASGPEGLARGKQVIIASSRGGMYSTGPATDMDFQETYLRTILGFVGIQQVQFVRAEGLNIGAAEKADAIRAAQASIGAISNQFAEAA